LILTEIASAVGRSIQQAESRSGQIEICIDEIGKVP
jgi:hypothetical protein